jgi:hypothetical protein
MLNPFVQFRDNLSRQVIWACRSPYDPVQPFGQLRFAGAVLPDPLPEAAVYHFPRVPLEPVAATPSQLATVPEICGVRLDRLHHGAGTFSLYRYGGEHRVRPGGFTGWRTDGLCRRFARLLHRGAR